jgi:acyl-CoA synthetase (AMP-forming)/AMP-acid ligase II
MTSPAELHRNLIQRVNVGDSLTRTAARYPDAPALIEPGRRLTYREFNGLVNRFANGLAARGYRRGDALALASGNSIEFLVTYYACAKLGVVCVPLNLGWRSEEVGYVLGHSGSRGIVVEAQLLPALVKTIASSAGVADVIVAPGRREKPRSVRAKGSGFPIFARAATPSRSASWRTGTRSATSTPAAPPRSPRASSATTPRSTWNRCRWRSRRGSTRPTGSRP